MIHPALAGLQDVLFRLQHQSLSWPVAVRWSQLLPETPKSHKGNPSELMFSWPPHPQPAIGASLSRGLLLSKPPGSQAL